MAKKLDTTHTYTALIHWSIPGAIVPYIRRQGQKLNAAAALWPKEVREYLLMENPTFPHKSNLTREDFEGLQANGQDLIRVTTRGAIGRLVTFTVSAPVPPEPQYLIDAKQALDAYGHLNWTVGNEDWIACFDAIRAKNRIVYHVVVNCESGGFIDTIEQRDIPISEASSLLSLPDYWASVCMEHYADSRKREHRVKARETARTEQSWQAHIESLVQA